MARVNEEGYVERITSSNTSGGWRGNPSNKATWRDWYLIKDCGKNKPSLHIRTIFFPKKYLGQKIRIKVEVISRKRKKMPLTVNKKGAVGILTQFI